MKYFCEDCNREYTLPYGDYMMEKKMECKCGKPSKLFSLKKVMIVESQLIYSSDSLFKIA